MILRYLLLVFFWVIIALACQCPYLYAQTGLTKVEGISQGMVISLLQDKEGFIWAGTLDGLNRYDGYGFKTFYHNPEDTNSIGGNTINNLFEDSKGRIWISMGKDGLDCYDKKSGRFIHVINHIPYLKGTNPDNFWVCEANYGKLYLLSNYSLHELTVDEAPNQNNKNGMQFSCRQILSRKDVGGLGTFYQIFAYQEQLLGIVSNDKVRFLNLKTYSWQQTNLTATMDGHCGNSLYWDAAQSTFWYLKNNQLYAVKNGKMLYRAPFVIDTRDINFCHINKGGDGCIYISVASKGIFKVAMHPSANPLSMSIEKPFQTNVTVFMVDKQGRAWLGTNGYGLYTYLPQKEGISKIIVGSINYINSLDSVVIVRSSNQLNELKGDGLHLLPYTIPAGQLVQLKKLPFGKQLAIIYQKIRDIDTYTIQIETAHGVVIRSFAYDTHNYPIDIRVSVDRGGQVWLSLSDGKIARIDKGLDSLQVVDFSNVFPQSPKSTVIMSIYESSDGSIWLPTNQGLVKMGNPQSMHPSFRLFENKPKDPRTISSNAVLSVVDDPEQPNKYLWVATRGGGLNKMDKESGQCTRYNTEQGLPNKVVYGVLTDNKGRLWLSTNNGISCFDPQKLYFHNFALQDGLQDNEFNTNAYCKHPDGRLFFGGVKGINIIQPTLVNFDSTCYPLFFTSLKVNNKLVSPRDASGILQNTIEQTKELYLPHDQNFLTITFATTDFSKLGYNNYRYQMEGVDKEWINGNTQNEVSYPNLPPGTYTFRVSNCNQNGDWNPTEAKMTIHISPPWWQSIFAYLAYCTAFSTGITLLVSNRVKRFRLLENVRMKEQEAKQLKELENIRTVFFNNITHELKTPLTMVIEPTRQMLLDGPNKGNPILMGVYENAERLLRLVGDLLDISKLEARKMHIHWSEGDIIPLLKSVLEAFKSKAEQKKVMLSYTAIPETLLVRADTGIVEKIAFNLLSNAIKFTDKGGSIALAVADIGNGLWKLTVTDTGIGIAEKDQPFIFDRYFQANGHPTRRMGGTGIGLALVKECVELLHGQVGLESQLGEGTTFWVTLPMFPPIKDTDINKDTATPLQPHAMPQPDSILAPASTFGTNGENPTVLIVEDHPEMAQFIALMVAESGYNVLFAKDGVEGYEKALETIPDIILSDWMMPNKDGLEMTVQIKANWITCHIPVILLTAKGSLESKIEGYDKGADAYLSKPFNKEKLLVRMKQLLETRRLMQRKFNPQSETLNIGTGIGNFDANSELQTEVEPNNLSGDVSIDEKKEKSPDEVLMEKINDYIVSNISDENLTLDNIALNVYMSRSQLIRKFNALTGETPGKYIRNMRLKHANEIVKHSGAKSMEDVMRKVGYTDIHYFISQYKERYGSFPQGID